jgi:hypothetical protein
MIPIEVIVEGAAAVSEVQVVAACAHLADVELEGLHGIREQLGVIPVAATGVRPSHPPLLRVEYKYTA